MMSPSIVVTMPRRTSSRLLLCLLVCIVVAAWLVPCAQGLPTRRLRLSKLASLIPRPFVPPAEQSERPEATEFLQSTERLRTRLSLASTTQAGSSVERPTRGGAAARKAKKQSSQQSQSHQSQTKPKGKKRMSFTAKARRRQKRNRELAAKRAGKYAKHLTRATRIDFGCGNTGRKCVCTLGLHASFSALQVEGYRLLSLQRLQESSACFSQAIDLYLARVGRYYVAGTGDNGDGSVHVSSTPTAPLAPGESLSPVPLSPDEAADAHATAQAIVDRLNAGPAPGWSAMQRNTAPQVERLRHLAEASSLAADAVNNFEKMRPGQQFFPPGSSRALESKTPSAPRLQWDEVAAQEPERAREVARVYKEQLREQWKSWGSTQDQENNLGQPKR